MQEDEDHHHIGLGKAILLLQSENEVERLLLDLCTPAEIRSLKERWKICQYLAKNKLSFREIARKTDTSLTTIGRVARFLREEKNGGYELLLKRLE